MKWTSLLVFALAQVALVTIAHATVLNFQFRTSGQAGTESDFTGNGVLREDGSIDPNPAAGTPSGSWNQIQFNLSNPFSSTPTSGFLTAAGDSSNVTVNFNGDVITGMDAYGGGPYGAIANQPLMTGYLATGSMNEPFMTIGNLTPGGVYDVILYGNNGGQGAGAAFSINGGATYSTGVTASGLFQSYVPGTDYVEIDNVIANLSGQLQVTALPSTYVIGIENGFQLLAVPEPGTGWLLALGATLGLAWKALSVRRR